MTVDLFFAYVGLCVFAAVLGVLHVVAARWVIDVVFDWLRAPLWRLWCRFVRELRGHRCHRCGEGFVFSFCVGCADVDAWDEYDRQQEREAKARREREAYENATRVPKSLYAERT